LSAVTVPLRTPVVLPLRFTAWPTNGLPAPLMNWVVPATVPKAWIPAWS